MQFPKKFIRKKNIINLKAKIFHLNKLKKIIKNIIKKKRKQ
jgi:hypothetical protein